MMSMCFFPGSAFISRGAITDVVAKAFPPKPGLATKLPKLSFVCFHLPADPSLEPLAAPKLWKVKERVVQSLRLT